MGSNGPLVHAQDILKWSPRCHEHFLPWRSAAALPMRENYIAEAGISDLYPGYELWRTDPRFHLLVYTIEGAGVLSTPAKVARIESGSLLVVPAHVSFGYRPHRGRWRFLWFHLRDTDHWSRLNAREPEIRRTYQLEGLRNATEGFLRESRRHDAGGRRAAELHAGLISVYIERELGSPLVAPDHSMRQQLDALWEIVANNLKADWNVPTLAAKLGLSSPHLFRVCMEHMHTSPMKVVTRLRMERAQELLILYSSPVRVIAEMVGYQNEFAFFTAFHRFSGVTPTQFRKRR